jgi:hypothetical protein
MKRRLLTYIIGISFLLMLNLSLINSATSPENQNRLNFGHVVMIDNINTDPDNLVPGNPGKLKMTLYNSGNADIIDVRAQLTLPPEIAFSNDVSEKKTSEINTLDSKNFEFSIIPLQNAAEGVYKGNLTITYLNYAGEERQDSYSIGLTVKATPKIFADIDSSQIYSENRLGEVTVIFVNNDVANIKYLTAELGTSPDYEIISSEKKYIGDLNSDDYQTVTFKIKAKDSIKKTTLPVTATYKDSLNKDYTQDFQIPLEILTAKELGIQTNNNYYWVIGLVVIVGVGYYFYRRNNKKRISKLNR